MNKVRYINLDRREWFEIGSYGSIMAHNSAVEEPNPKDLTGQIANKVLDMVPNMRQP